MTAPATRHTSHVTRRRRPAAFTLVELLVVIAIIAILAGLGFAGLQGAMESSRRAQARNDVHQVAAAIRAYQLEYGRLPTAGSEIQAITAQGDRSLNSKGIVFLEAKAARGTPPKGGMQDGRLLDPWGQEYNIILDDNYDNRIEHRGETHFTTVIVETSPPDDNRPINNVQ